MPKKKPKSKTEPGSPGIFLRIPPAICKHLEKGRSPTCKTIQSVILNVLADHYAVTEPLPTRGGQKRELKQ